MHCRLSHNTFFTECHAKPDKDKRFKAAIMTLKQDILIMDKYIYSLPGEVHKIIPCLLRELGLQACQ